jgi:hypothetical protein
MGTWIPKFLRLMPSGTWGRNNSGPDSPFTSNSEARKLQVSSEGAGDGGGEGVAGTGSGENPLRWGPMLSSFRRELEGSEVNDVPVETAEAGESIEEAEKEDALEALRS